MAQRVAELMVSRLVVEEINLGRADLWPELEFQLVSSGGKLRGSPSALARVAVELESHARARQAEPEAEQVPSPAAIASACELAALRARHLIERALGGNGRRSRERISTLPVVEPDSATVSPSSS